MNAIRLVSLLLVLSAAAPALAANTSAERAPLSSVLALPDACAHSRALEALGSNGMAVVANVPRTKALYRFVVGWKSDLFAVTVSTRSCSVEVVDYAKALKPYCDYVPGIRSACRLESLSQ